LIFNFNPLQFFACSKPAGKVNCHKVHNNTTIRVGVELRSCGGRKNGALTNVGRATDGKILRKIMRKFYRNFHWNHRL